MDLPGYAELHCRSNFSFLTGASHPEELVERAAELRYAALAITDECSLAGVVRAHMAARQTPRLHLIVGSEMQLTLPGEPAVPHARLVLLAQTRRGYGNLSHWISVARRRADKGCYRAYPGDVQGEVPNAPTLAGLPECQALLLPDVAQSLDEIHGHALWLKTWFGDRAAIAVQRLLRPGEGRLLEIVREVATFVGLPIVATGDVLMHVRARKPLQDVLTATRLKRPIAQCGMAIEANAEQHLRARVRLAQLYEPEWLHNTLQLAARCSFELTELKYEYPKELVPEGETPTGYLRKLVAERFAGRFPKHRYSRGARRQQRHQIRRELAVIRRLNYEAYFLTVADIVRWAREQKILCQGRGSAANSVVCYCLGVTEVNPTEAQLLFERFISVERNEPPDIDVDFEHQRREEVIQYIYGKYGRHRAALTAVVITYRTRSALRDAGRALGIDLQRIDALSKTQHWADGAGIAPDRLRENGFDPESPLVRLWSELTFQLIGFPRHLSQHPGGFVIARDQIEQLVPIENAAMENRIVVQWDKDDLDALGLIKVDILALGMLSALRRAFDLMGRKLGHAMTMQDIPQRDAATYDMICRADTIGVFQIESRAQMSMLPRLKPRNYYDLVVEVAIVRPGPIEGGMVHPYLKNRLLEDDQIDYPKDLRPALQRTKGVPIFQEQVMQIAILAADFTPGEADQLRRAMAAWKRKGGLEPFRDRLLKPMLEKGYPQEFAERIFKQIKGFGEYGFPESHAAGFAQLAYISSWIKRHHPDAFLAALLNSQPMGFYQPAQLVRDARLNGVEVLPVDVQRSECETTFEGAAAHASHNGPAQPFHSAGFQRVRLGFSRVTGLADDAAARIVAARAEAPFANVEDLARRARLDAHALRLLAEADALRGLSGHRYQAAWAVAGVDTRPTEMLRATRVAEVPAMLAAPSEVEDTLADYQSIGLTLKRHPLALLREQLAAEFKVQTAAVLRNYPSGRLARASGLVTHRQRPETASGTVFVTLEDETGAVNVIVWPRVFDTQRQALLAARLLTVYGRWQREGDVMHLIAMRMVDHSALLQGLVARSRDFR
ncbi:MAG TPA: error-prone DNA polymerase [Burkholderiaceae bacterium]|nr:error-prone DNA polymerase [Burkholderiaceae bacterium]